MNAATRLFSAARSIGAVTVHSVEGVVIQYELEPIARRMVITRVPVFVALLLVSWGVGFRSVSVVLIALLGEAWAIGILVLPPNPLLVFDHA